MQYPSISVDFTTQPTSSTRSQLARHDFDSLVPLPKSNVRLRPATLQDVDWALEMAAASIDGSLADSQTISSVIRINPENISIFEKGAEHVGICALLMLHEAGRDALLTGKLNFAEPQSEFLASTNDEVAAIYVWALVAPSLASEGLIHMSQMLRRTRFQHASIFARPTTRGGARMLRGLGFTPFEECGQFLHIYRRKLALD